MNAFILAKWVMGNEKKNVHLCIFDVYYIYVNLQIQDVLYVNVALNCLISELNDEMPLFSWWVNFDFMFCYVELSV